MHSSLLSLFRLTGSIFIPTKACVSRNPGWRTQNPLSGGGEGLRSLHRSAGVGLVAPPNPTPAPGDRCRAAPAPPAEGIRPPSCFSPLTVHPSANKKKARLSTSLNYRPGIGTPLRPKLWPRHPSQSRRQPGCPTQSMSRRSSSHPCSRAGTSERTRNDWNALQCGNKQ